MLLSASVRLLKQEYDLKHEVGYTFVKGDLHWSNDLIYKFASIAVFGGMMASLVGLGGGVVYNPLMMEFGVNPKVSSATSMYMIMLSTLSGTLQFLMMGILPVDYSIYLAIIVVVCTIIANLALSSLIGNSGRPSFIAIFLAAVIVLCTCIVLITALINVHTQLSDGEDIFSFNSYCNLR